MGKPRHSRLCIFSVLNSSAHLPRCRRFTARLATSRARLAELRGVACSFAVEDLHLLPKHQLAWRTPYLLNRNVLLDQAQELLHAPSLD